MPPRKRSLHQHLKHTFIPHKGNGYHPHIFHAHRVIGHAAIFTAVKVGVILFATLIPNEAFLAPNILSEQAARIITLTNNLRIEQGLKPLSTVSLLVNSAQARADDMGEKEYFSHVSPTGERLGAFLRRSGYSYRAAGENLAMGFSDADGAMNGWMKSPTHYANLIDGEFEDIGVGVRGGVYQGKPTIYLAQHFGVAEKPTDVLPSKPLPEPKNEHPVPAPAPAQELQQVAVAKPVPSKQVVTLAATAAVPAPTSTIPVPVPVEVAAPLAVAQAPVAAPAEPPRVRLSAAPVSAVVYDADRSSLGWQDEGSHVRVRAEVYAVGQVKTAQVIVNGYTVTLRPEGQGKLVGSMLLPESSDELFRVIVPSTVQFTDQAGQTTQATVDWKEPKVVSETPWDRYMQAKSWFSGSISVFTIVHWFFLLGGGFFGLALLVSIGINLKKQHPHVVLKAAALVAMLLLYAKW